MSYFFFVEPLNCCGLKICPTRSSFIFLFIGVQYFLPNPGTRLEQGEHKGLTQEAHQAKHRLVYVGETGGNCWGSFISAEQ